MGQELVPLDGSHQMIIVELGVGAAEDGLDLSGDGSPDNKFAALSGLLDEPIALAFANYDLVFPLEFFDMDEVGEDSCVKAAAYSADYRRDLDGDGHGVAGVDGDCDDHRAAVSPDADEVPDNGIDDNCNGYTDETLNQGDGGTILVPSTDDTDADSDGVSVAAGDCDDHNDGVSPTLNEICGDGLDNNCDGVADWTVGAEPSYCSPFDSELDPLQLEAESFLAGDVPVRAFRQGIIESRGGSLHLRAGKSVFPIEFPIPPTSVLDLVISEAEIDGELVMTPGGWALQGARLGGVLRAIDADRSSGLDIPIVGLLPENTLLDGFFAGALSGILGLPIAPSDGPGAGCYTPDIDVDGDGLEAFCDSDPDDEVYEVDLCVDGDGTVVVDSEGAPCSQALDSDGKPRFVDGVSLVILFEAMPSEQELLMP
jgi:hypothetical protein